MKYCLWWRHKSLQDTLIKVKACNNNNNLLIYCVEENLMPGANQAKSKWAGKTRLADDSWRFSPISLEEKKSCFVIIIELKKENNEKAIFITFDFNYFFTQTRKWADIQFSSKKSEQNEDNSIASKIREWETIGTHFSFVLDFYTKLD